MEANNAESRAYDRSSPKWGHPESVEEGFYTIGRPDFYYGMESYTDEDYTRMRAQLRVPIKEMALESSDFEGRSWEDYYTEHGCPEEPNAAPVHIVVSRPQMKTGEKLPVMFCISGGGLDYGGTAELPMSLVAQIARCSGEKVIMLSTEYRIAPKDKYPAAINDLHAAYIWMLEHANELGIDTDKIIMWGQSTGGHLILSVTFRLKRYGWCGGPMPRGVISQVPVMDDVSLNQSNRFAFSGDEGTEQWSWSGQLARAGMRYWLGERYGDPELPPEAVPNRATSEDVAGFPPVWFPSEAEFDPGRDSVMDFVRLLQKADVFCDLHIWGGTTHVFNAAEGTDFSKRFQQVAGGALRDAIKYDFRRQWK